MLLRYLGVDPDASDADARGRSVLLARQGLILAPTELAAGTRGVFLSSAGHLVPGFQLTSFIRDRDSAMGRTRTSGRVDGDIIR